ncbi:PREDICTED: probable protein phosphatase 2C 55 [Tarenaya hassleriana]|uniref:probable protein phosphatase 2C 55 n=1 Tax=Tarenaya hassleriana TaxID=28532 RepID=UPI00053C6ACE|nr:PREDICTED: probable protein phosphatase 2C 55 [Tarenaya hassleriana]
MPPGYLSRLRHAVQDGVQRQVTGQGGLVDGLEVLIGQGKFGFGSSKSFHSRLTDPKGFLGPATVFAASSDLLLVNQRRNLSVVGAVSRTFSVPSVSGPSFQVCGYHVDLLLSEPSTSVSHSGKVLGRTMAASGSKFFVDRHLDALISKRSLSGNNTCFVYGRSFSSSGKISMRHGKRRQPENSATIYGFFVYRAAKKWIDFYPHSGWGFRGFHSSISNYFSAGTAPEPDVPSDNSRREEQLRDSSSSSSSSESLGVNLTSKPLKLVSGSCYLPHPDKEDTGGEDAHFICPEEQAVGVADGVGGWADLGIDAGLYSRELMSNSVSAIQDEPKGSVDPARVLEKAYTSTKAKGSSTACILALTDLGLHAINLGDSGFMVVRDGCTVFRSPVQQHDFNFTYQLESGNNGDLPSSGQVFTVQVAPGDIIISGTDGLFDNLYNNEITAVVVQAVRGGLGPKVTAQKIAALARQRAEDRDRQTPFSKAAQDAGFRYYGGKLDDITVVVSYVTGSDKETRS